MQTHNAEVAELIGATAVSSRSPEGYGVTGAGIRVGVWDEGHARASHIDLEGRVVERDLGGWVEHATHTTATVAGSGTGAEDARGMAPGARVWAFDWLLDAAEMEESASGIGVSSNAYGPALGWGENPVCPMTPTWWGAGASREDAAFGRYGGDAAAVDALAYRTDLLSVWAAGNERADIGVAPGESHAHGAVCDVLYEDTHLRELTLQYGTVGGAAVAKNGLTVGAAVDLASSERMPHRVVPMEVSGFGPTADGRIKPELLAGGEAVQSASDQDDDAYVAMSGTSSATAATAGAVALLSELYRATHDGADARGVEMKALLVHTAFDAGAPGPDYATGHGLLDVQAAADLLDGEAPPMDEEPRARRIHVGVLRDEEPFELSEGLAIPNSPLRVTLVWNDPPASPAWTAKNESTLVNDLDLSVRSPGGRVFRPWSLDPTNPRAAATNDGRNRVDNVEVVDVPAEDNRDIGAWTVRVEAGAKLWRGRAQPFAIVTSMWFNKVPAQPALAAPRTVEVVVPLAGAEPSPARVTLRNRRTGTLAFRARSLTPWLTVGPTSGTTPAEIEFDVDASAFTRAGEVLGQVEIDGDDPAGPWRIGVIARVTCTPDCKGRVCGMDARCGEICGRCGPEQTCRDGACVPWQPRCPDATLESALGPTLVHGVPRGTGSQSASCGGEDGSEVGVTWTAPEDGRFAFTTRGSRADTVLYARAGQCGGEELACNDDSADRTSALALDLNQGERVALLVDSFDGEGGGEIRLNAARATCPNADLGSRVGQLVVRASTVGGIDELAGVCGGKGSEDVAFAWTAPRTSRYRFALFDPAYQAVLYVRDGDCDGSELGCSAATDVGPVEVEITKGQSVAIVVDGRDGRSGAFTLDVFDVDATCGGACDGVAPAGVCSCDASCVAAGDCCADACARCGHCRCDPDCQGRQCGDDGCGGDCGGCAPGLVCADGACKPDACAGVSCDACSVCEAGACVPLREGAHCEDDDLCTVLDACRAGRCEGEPRGCDDGFVCTEDRCDESTGRCEHEARAEICPSPGGADQDAGWGDAGWGDAGWDDEEGRNEGAFCGCGVPGRAPPNPATASLALACAAWGLRRARARGRRG